MQPSELQVKSLGQINAIHWIAGEDTCVLAYLDAERNGQVQCANVEDLDALRPSFKRLLACAAACVPRAATTDKSMATIIKHWDSVLAGRPAEDFMFSDWAVREWSGLTKFNLNTATPACAHRTTRPTGILTFASDQDEDWLSLALLNANIPGVVDACTLMSVEHAMSTTGAFKVYVGLSRKMTFNVLAENEKRLAATLRACLAMGVPLVGLEDILLTSVDGAPSAEKLPDLTEAPAL